MAEGTAFGEEYTQQAHLQAQKEIDAVINTRSITVK